MNNDNWKQYFDQKAEMHGASVKSSDYFDDDSFFMQRNSTLHWLGELAGKTILDAGCGVGAFSEPLTKKNEVYGVDFSEKSLQFAAARGLRTMPGDLANLAFPDDTFDVVLCIGVIQLIRNYQPVLRELTRVTKPGGSLLIQTLHKGSLQRKLLRLFERRKKFDTMYGMDDLQDAFKLCGLEQIEFLKMYHPFTFVNADSQAGLLDLFCTSFAIKGRKKLD